MCNNKFAENGGWRTRLTHVIVLNINDCCTLGAAHSMYRLQYSYANVVYKYYDAVPAIFLFAVGTVLPGQGEDDFVSAVEQLREVLRERMEMYNLELRACESMLTKE